MAIDGEHEKRERPDRKHAHWRCDCVPDLGPAHCHRCSGLQGRAVAWDEAPCSANAEEAFEITETALALRPELTREQLADEVAALALQAFAKSCLGKKSEPEPEPVVEKEPEPQPVPEPQSTKPRPVPTPLPPRTKTRLDSDEPPHPWRITDLARGQAEAFEMTPREAVELVRNARIKHSTSRGGINHYVDGLLILVNEENDCIISIVEREEPAVDPRFAPRGGVAGTKGRGVRKAKGGGPGRRMPSSTSELLKMAAEHGFTSKMQGSGHWLLQHPEHAGSVTVSATASDHRSLQNTISDIKRATGIDVRLSPA